MAFRGPTHRHYRALPYRPDIDGLRAIAVTGVIVYHAPSVASLPGGFLGVDIFFVISGFLITNLVLSAIGSGNFSFRDFYVRRARRLLPVFFVVAIATIIASWLVLDSGRMSDFADSLFFSALGVSNLYFMGQDPYWADSASTLPFLHTWSLSVEEQFYLLFPALLVLTSRTLRSSGRLIFFSALGTLSFFFAVWLSEINPTYSFYLLPTRAWELLIGVALALAFHHRDFRLPKFVAGIFSAVGLALIGFSFVFLGGYITSPSVFTIVPTAGAALAIIGGMTANPVSRILAIKPLVGVGLISYGLYLWHYPILALSEVAFGSGLRMQLASVALAVCLSVGTYFLIEKPLRRGTWAPLVKTVGVGGAVFTLFFAVGSGPTSGYAISTPIPVAVKAQDLEKSDFLQMVEADESEATIMVFGDSHMQTLVPGLAAKSADAGMGFLNGTLSSCLFLAGLELEEEVQQKCGLETQNSRLNATMQTPNSFVVLGGRFALALEGERFNNLEGGIEDGGLYRFWEPGTQNFSHENQVAQISKSFVRTTETLLDQGHILILVYPIPEAGWDVPEEIFSRATTFPPQMIKFGGIQRIPGAGYSWPIAEPVTTSYELYVERSRSTFDLFDSIPGDRIIRIFPHEIFCDSQWGGRCGTHDDMDIFYSDDDHLSTAGADLVNGQIMSAISHWNATRQHTK